MYCRNVYKHTVPGEKEITVPTPAKPLLGSFSVARRLVRKWCCNNGPEPIRTVYWTKSRYDRSQHIPTVMCAWRVDRGIAAQLVEFSRSLYKTYPMLTPFWEGMSIRLTSHTILIYPLPHNPPLWSATFALAKRAAVTVVPGHCRRSGQYPSSLSCPTSLIVVFSHTLSESSLRLCSIRMPTRSLI